MRVTPNPALYASGGPAQAAGTIVDDEIRLAEIPTAGGWGLLLLTMGLGAFALKRIHGG
jgi:hypothetical protein